MLKTKFLVYFFHFLLNWEDRMWSFGIGLFLINFSPESLLLTALYGFSTGGAVFLFGAVVGDLVDRTPRFKAVRIALIVRKVSLCLCACLICFVHWFKDEISAAVSDNILLYVSYIAIIIIGVISNLANIARRIAVERDWVVEICEKKKNRLAAMTATMRGIDLTAQVLTPLIIGQVIDLTEIGYGAVLVAGWNLFAVFLEIFVAWKVYISVPSLKSKMYKPKRDDRFGYSQGLSAAILGQLRAGVAAAGIVGTILYPWVRRRISTEHTGASSLAFQILSLTLCVVSVFTPGSPFNLSSSNNINNKTTSLGDFVNDIANNSVEYNFTLFDRNETLSLNMSRFIPNNSASRNFTQNASSKNEDMSIWFLMSGIIASRIGLVMGTLAIQQLFLERVKEAERGIVGGVQSTLNWLMDMLKFVIVIFMPHPNQYGLLVIISFLFICMAFIFYLKFLCSTLGKSNLEADVNTLQKNESDDNQHNDNEEQL